MRMAHKRSMPSLGRVLVLVLTAALLVTACGDDGAEAQTAADAVVESATVTPSTTAPITTTTAAAPTTTAAAPTTTAATTTTTRASQSHEVTVAYDGADCAFDPPSDPRVGDTLTVHVVNSSDHFVFATLYRLKAGESKDRVAELATQPELATQDAHDWGQQTKYVFAFAGSESDVIYDPSSGPLDGPWQLPYDRDYAMVCWETPSNGNQPVTLGIAADAVISVTR